MIRQKAIQKRFELTSKLAAISTTVVSTLHFAKASAIWDVSEKASTQLVDKITTMYSHIFIPLVLVNFFLYFVVLKDEKQKAVEKKVLWGIFIFYVMCKCYSIFPTTMDIVSGWFTG